jgi:hypothetical protein
MKRVNRSFANVAEFRIFVTSVTNQNLIHEKITIRLHSANACYLSVQNLLSSLLLSKNVNIKIYKTIVLPVVLYRCETLFLILRGRDRLKVFENSVLRITFGP